VSDTKTTIELNGKRYDTLTGKLVDAIASTVKKPTPAKSGINIDGFTHAHSPKQRPAPARKKPAPASRTTVANRSVGHHKLQQAKTLMRNAVTKPIPFKSAKHTEKQHLVRPDKLIDERAKRATHISKSLLVSRFGGFSGAIAIKKRVVKLPVQPAPAHHNTKTEHQTAAQRSFSKTLETATSHKQPKLHKRSLRHKTAKKLGITSKTLSISAAMLAIIVLSGFIAYQNVPNIAIRVAATKAGFAAAMPRYLPSGFAMNGKIQASSGKVTINFKSNSDSRSFAIIQEPSNWTSQSLLENYVSIKDQPYQTYEDKGRTIYIYNGTNATWVNGGVWYQVAGNSNLNSDQLINIANSL
jgi:hypothetical protein